MNPNLSPAMQRAVTAAQRGRLERFRKGYAHDKRGPFLEPRTIFSAISRGALAPSPSCRFVSIPKARVPIAERVPGDGRQD